MQATVIVEPPKDVVAVTWTDGILGGDPDLVRVVQAAASGDHESGFVNQGAFRRAWLLRERALWDPTKADDDHLSYPLGFVALAICAVEDWGWWIQSWSVSEDVRAPGGWIAPAGWPHAPGVYPPRLPNLTERSLAALKPYLAHRHAACIPGPGVAA